MTEHPDPFVRKSALVATAELLRAVPAARLAGALMRRNGGGGSADDATFAARLERLQEHLRHTHADAPDATLRFEASPLPAAVRAMPSTTAALQVHQHQCMPPDPTTHDRFVHPNRVSVRGQVRPQPTVQVLLLFMDRISCQHAT